MRFLAALKEPKAAQSRVKRTAKPSPKCRGTAWPEREIPHRMDVWAGAADSVADGCLWPAVAERQIRHRVAVYGRNGRSRTGCVHGRLLRKARICSMMKTVLKRRGQPGSGRQVSLCCPGGADAFQYRASAPTASGPPCRLALICEEWRLRTGDTRRLIQENLGTGRYETCSIQSGVSTPRISYCPGTGRGCTQSLSRHRQYSRFCQGQ
jgi:hypothetical protein